MDDESWAADFWHKVNVPEAIDHHVCEGAHLLPEQGLNTGERAYQNDARDVVSRSQSHTWSCAQGPPEEFDVLARPLKDLRGEAHGGLRVFHDRGLGRPAGAYSVARVLHCQDMYLEEVSHGLAKRVTRAEILRIRVEVQHQESSMPEWQKRTWHLVPVASRNQKQLTRIARDVIRRPRRGEHQALNGIPTGRIRVQQSPHRGRNEMRNRRKCLGASPQAPAACA
mmetsp:Transcript_22765/g.65617  ORF Transcript_22765/g.65617 Transcript_22765/m.65617 type:complete len:225 (+) Transcript_22765:722-1396(+)